MSADTPFGWIGVGVVGLGFMGRTHAAAYRRWGARLVAACDLAPSPSAGAGNLASAGDSGLDLGGAPLVEDLSEFLATPGLDLVSVCTPTDTHEEIACAVLAAGKHAVVEKPAALSSASALRIAQAARAAGRLCMPAMCMRFWPAWAWVKRAIDDRRFGAVRALRCERVGAWPSWSGGFYRDPARSGGPVLDLHVHDTDFVVHALGVPDEVVSVGTADHLTTLYRHHAHPTLHAVASGGCVEAPAWAFRMRLTVEFERAVTDFELGRDPELLVFNPAGGRSSPDLEPVNGWEAELRAMLEAVAGGRPDAPTTMDEAASVLRVVEAERESLRTGRPVRV